MEERACKAARAFETRRLHHSLAITSMELTNLNNSLDAPIFLQNGHYKQSQLSILLKVDQQVDQVQNKGDQKLKESSLVSKSTINQEGRSSSLVRTLALRAKGRRSESGSAHHQVLMKLRKYTQNDTFNRIKKGWR